jgi:hypothetical protein
MCADSVRDALVSLCARTLRCVACCPCQRACGWNTGRYDIEIGNGLGDLKGKAWRLGLMGFNARHDIAMLLVAALKDALEQQGYKAPRRAAM